MDPKNGNGFKPAIISLYGVLPIFHNEGAVTAFPDRKFLNVSETHPFDLFSDEQILAEYKIRYPFEIGIRSKWFTIMLRKKRLLPKTLKAPKSYQSSYRKGSTYLDTDDHQ